MKTFFHMGQGKHDRKVIAFVNAYWKTHYRPPTVREIATACGITSTAVAHNTLRRLARSGEYQLADTEARSVVPNWVKSAIDAHDASKSRPEAPRAK
jgi:SOS-response transcriptional repressor LexA